MSAATLTPAEVNEIDDPICALIETTPDIRVLERLAINGSPHPEALGAVAANRSCPSELLRRLYDGAGGDVVILMNLADNPATPPDILTRLATHEDWVIRMVVAHNPATSTTSVH